MQALLLVVIFDAPLLQLSDNSRLFTVAGVCFASGFAFGYIFATTMAEGEMENFRRKFAAVIFVGWFISLLASIIISDYSTPMAVHAVMGAAVGYLFGGGNPITSALTGHRNETSNTDGDTGGNTGGNRGDGS